MSPAMDDATHPYIPRHPAKPLTPTIWQRAGVLVGYPDKADPAKVAAKCVEHGFNWVAPKIHDAVKIEPGAAEFIRGIRAAANGLTVVGWGVQQYEPVMEARLVAFLVNEYKLAAYIADAEGPYKADYRMPDGTMGVRGRAAEFVTEYRDLLPTLPSALTTFGAGSRKPDGTYWQLGDTLDPRVGPMDFHAFASRAFRLLGQAYPNEAGDVYSVPNVIAHASQCHWPLSQQHPMLGCYPFSGGPGYDPVQYVRELEAGRTVGFSVFLADEMSDTDWTVLGQAIKAGKVAR